MDNDDYQRKNANRERYAADRSQQYNNNIINKQPNSKDKERTHGSTNEPKEKKGGCC